MEKRIIIFSGYNQRAVVAFLRTLLENNIDAFSIFAAGSEDPILLTKYKKYVFYIRKNRLLDWEELSAAIDLVCKEYSVGECMIVPSTEGLNRSVLANRAFLGKHHCISPMVEEGLYIKISDKESFWELCKENGLCVPEEISLGASFEKAFVAKPRNYVASTGKIYSPIIVKTADEFKKFCMDYPIEDFMLQEYISGESYYLLYYFTKNGQVYRFSQINYCQQPAGKSILVAACANLHCSEISKQYESLFLKMGYYGFVMVELRKCGDKYYMIEANPRFWGPSQLFCDAGYNFFEFFLQEYGYLDKIPERKIDRSAKYLWIGGAHHFSIQECVWHSDGYERFQGNSGEYFSADVYRREDTSEIFEAELRNWLNI